MTKPFIIKRDAAGEIRVYLMDDKGQTIAWSESYKRYRSARNCVRVACSLDTCDSLIKEENDTDGVKGYYFRVVSWNNRKLMRSITVPSWEDAELIEEILFEAQDMYFSKGSNVDAMIDNYVFRKNLPPCTQ